MATVANSLNVTKKESVVLYLSLQQKCVISKCSIFWVITQCSPLKVNTAHFTTFIDLFTFPTMKMVVTAPPKRQLNFNRLHGVTLQKM
jgi:hypothetical protein